MQEPTTPVSVTPMPWTEKFVNIFAAPGELYENVRNTGPTTSNWLLPWIIFAVVAIAMNFLMMNTPSLAEQLGAAMRQGLEKSVADGKMTQEQADAAYEYMRPGSVYFTVLSIGGTILWTFGGLFALGLVYWLIGKSVMSAKVPYMKTVEVVGLTYLISTLEVIVTTLMMIGFDRINATPSAAFFLSDYDITNKVHLLMGKANIFTFWVLAVTSIGLSKLFQKDLPKVLVLVVALWLLWTIATVFSGCGGGM